MDTSAEIWMEKVAEQWNLLALQTMTVGTKMLGNFIGKLGKIVSFNNFKELIKG